MACKIFSHGNNFKCILPVMVLLMGINFKLGKYGATKGFSIVLKESCCVNQLIPKPKSPRPIIAVVPLTPRTRDSHMTKEWKFACVSYITPCVRNSRPCTRRNR